MSSRANYVLKDGGRLQIFYSHGGQHIPRDFFFGPEAALSIVRSSSAVESLLDDVWCEGAALIDLDSQSLLLWGGEEEPRDVQLRELLLELLAISWEGWTVNWAHHGIFDIADVIGTPRAAVEARKLATEEPADRQRLLQGPWTQSWVRTLLTVGFEDGAFSDLLPRYTAEECLGLGRDLLQMIEKMPSQTCPTGAHWCGTAFLDVTNQLIWLCPTGAFGTHNPRLAGELERVWPGWRVVIHSLGLPYHMLLTGRDPTPHLRSETDLVDGLRVSILACTHEPLGLFPRLQQREEYFQYLLSTWQSRKQP